MKDLAKYLRCSGFPMGNCPLDCPYLTKEEIKEGIPIKADIVIDGVEYWTSCDVDRIVKDAADYIEQLEKEKKYRWHGLRENPEDLPEKNVNVLVMPGLARYEVYSLVKYDWHEEPVWIDSSGYLEFDEVMAWREIEPLEVE